MVAREIHRSEGVIAGELVSGESRRGVGVVACGVVAGVVSRGRHFVPGVLSRWYANTPCLNYRIQ